MIGCFGENVPGDEAAYYVLRLGTAQDIENSGNNETKGLAEAVGRGQGFPAPDGSHRGICLQQCPVGKVHPLEQRQRSQQRRDACILIPRRFYDVHQPFKPRINAAFILAGTATLVFVTFRPYMHPQGEQSLSQSTIPSLVCKQAATWCPERSAPSQSRNRPYFRDRP